MELTEVLGFRSKLLIHPRPRVVTCKIKNSPSKALIFHHICCFGHFSPKSPVKEMLQFNSIITDLEVGAR